MFTKCKEVLMLMAIIIIMMVFPTSGVAGDDLIKKIEKTGELRCCYAEDIPWTFKDPGTDKWTGLTHDIAKEMAADIGVKLVDVDATWATVIQSVTTGKCDLVAAALYQTTKRAKRVLFSQPFAYAFTTVWVHKDSKLKTYEELDQPGNVLATWAGTATEDSAKRTFKKLKIKSYVTDSETTMMLDLVNKRIDGFCGGLTSTKKFIKENPKFTIRSLEAAPIATTGISFAINSGEYAFQQLVNIWLNNYIESGKMNVKWEKWFGFPYKKK